MGQASVAADIQAAEDREQEEAADVAEDRELRDEFEQECVAFICFVRPSLLHLAIAMCTAHCWPSSAQHVDEPGGGGVPLDMYRPCLLGNLAWIISCYSEVHAAVCSGQQDEEAESG